MDIHAKGAAIVLAPEDGESYWQPGPSHGYMTVKLSPENMPSNMFAAGTQIVPPGCVIRDHGHSRNDEVLFVYEGTGTATIEGVTHRVEPGSLLFLGRYVEHKVVNDGDVDMKIFWLFTPPGLDRVVKEIGRPRVAGEAPPERFDRPDHTADVLRQNGWATPAQMQAGRTPSPDTD